MALCKTCIYRRIFHRVCFGSYDLGSREIYLYIGITSLYLYDSTGPGIFQDGIFHKIIPKLVWKTQIHRFSPILKLTFFFTHDILNVLGRCAPLSVISKEPRHDHPAF